jgi:hypothetical protein
MDDQFPSPGGRQGRGPIQYDVNEVIANRGNELAGKALLTSKRPTSTNHRARMTPSLRNAHRAYGESHRSFCPRSTRLQRLLRVESAYPMLKSAVRICRTPYRSACAEVAAGDDVEGSRVFSVGAHSPARACLGRYRRRNGAERAEGLRHQGGSLLAQWTGELSLTGE